LGDRKLAELRREYDERKEKIGVVCGEGISRDLMERKISMCNQMVTSEIRE